MSHPQAVAVEESAPVVEVAKGVQPPSPARRRASRKDVPSAPLIDPATISAPIEAVLLCSERPVSALRLAEALKLVAPREPGDDAPPSSASDSATGSIRNAIDWLNGQYEQTGRAFRIEQVAGGFRMMTLPQYAEAVAAFQGARAKTALTHAALETLAIIAYKQPMTRAKLEAIRGVACGDILRSLVDRRLVTIAGRAEELGRPILYATTKHFLETFGLSGLRDLPTIEEIRERAAAGEPLLAAGPANPGVGVSAAEPALE